MYFNKKVCVYESSSGLFCLEIKFLLFTFRAKPTVPLVSNRGSSESVLMVKLTAETNMCTSRYIFTDFLVSVDHFHLYLYGGGCFYKSPIYTELRFVLIGGVASLTWMVTQAPVLTSCLLTFA